MTSPPPQNGPDGSMAQVLESALLAALKPISQQIQNLSAQITTQQQEIQTLKAENQALKTQLEAEQKLSQTEIGKSLNSLLNSLKSLTERLEQNENKIERLETQQTRTQKLIKAIDQKIPNAFNLPRSLTINGKTITYRGLFLLFLMLLGCTAGTVYFAQQTLITKTNRMYDQINSIEIRLKRLENRLK